MQDGDSSMVQRGNATSYRLDARSKRAFAANGGPFWDPYYRALDNITMPVGQDTISSMANNTPYAVDTSRPRATNVSLSYPREPGVYAPGTTLKFNVTNKATPQLWRAVQAQTSLLVVPKFFVPPTTEH